jgi:magnesium transporter
LKRVDSNYDVNNPPSVPSTPKIGPEADLDDVMLMDPHPPSGVPDRRRSVANVGESLINIDGELTESPFQGSTPSTPQREDGQYRRHTLANPAAVDVCFPVEGLSEIAEEDYLGDQQAPYRHRRRRVRDWPELSVLEEWSREEKEGRTEGIRAKKISEPVLVDGRLRPARQRWHRAEEELPFRFTYFNEEFPSTIHSQTFSELVQPGQTFRDLFIPDPPELIDSSSDEEQSSIQLNPENRSVLSPHDGSVAGTRHSSVAGAEQSGKATPVNGDGGTRPSRPKRYGNRPTFWLDVLSPTETEMRMISKAFGIHPLTAEDILMQEAREKVELFRSYYFVSYKSFELDTHSEDYLEPVTLYFVVFRDGVLSFHFSQSPHPANVRRRIRQLKDYLILSADWIAYALLDDVTDVFAPLIQSIEDEVDEIDNSILQLQSEAEESSKGPRARLQEKAQDAEKRSEAGETGVDASGNLLRRIGQARRRVTLATRLLGNKADVIKAFAKRCNEQWDVAPRSEIGLYLGDIQDHIVTMNSNLTHYESLLGRAHSNYLAQLNFMTAARQEETNAVLGKLSVLGTIFLPLNVVTGMFGANFKVPGRF